MKKCLLFIYLLTAAFGLSLLAWLIPANTEVSGYGLSPALLPNIIAATMLVTSVILFCKTVRGCTDAPSPVTSKQLLHLILFTCVFLGTFPLMGVIGFLPGGILSMALLQILCGQRDPVWLLSLSLALPGIFYLAIKTVIQVPLP